VRYAYFAASQRLAIELGGKVTVYDTLDYQIGGFSQQQGAGESTTFTSQSGTVDVASLPIISGDEPQRASTAQPASFSQSGGDIFGANEKLAGLRSKGILSDEEFSTKKAEQLRRL
jgi:hypothetical protein